MQNTNSLTDLDELINKFRASFSQIKVQFNNQQTIIDQLFQQNKDILSHINKLNKYIDKSLSTEKGEDGNSSDKDDTEEEEEDFPEDIGSFNLSTETVFYNGEKFDSDEELLFCGREKLTEAQNFLKERQNKDIFPQGIKFCCNLLKKLQKESGSLFVLTHKSAGEFTRFFFSFNNISDLSPTRGWIKDSRDEINEEIEKLKGEYSTDVYPQGIESCHSILNEQLEANGAVRILVRSNDSKWTRYYFKTRHIKETPKEKFTWITGKKKLEDQLKIIDEIVSDKKDFFRKIVNEAIENDKPIFSIETEDTSSNIKTINFFPESDIIYASSAEWWHPLIKKNILREMKLIDQRSNSIYPQGKVYCKNLLIEKRTKNEMLHIIVRNTSKDTWLYFKS